MKINFVKLNQKAVEPVKSYSGDAAFDLTVSDYMIVRRRGVTMITYYTGIAIEIPTDYFGLIVPRSSVYLRNHFLANSSGVIDSGYRGELIANFTASSLDFEQYKAGERFAQLLILPVPNVEFVEVESLTPSERGDGGFGSSGK